MISEVKTCIQCGEEFQIFHLAQRQKKYCSYKCSDFKWAKIRKNSYVRKKK